LFTSQTLNFLPRFVTYPRIGIITDMDGTISPIVPIPEQAQPTPRNRELLAALRDCLTLVAVVSGRGAADVRKRVDLAGLVYIGNHGMDRWTGMSAQRHPDIVLWRVALEKAINALQPHLVSGMVIEDKGATLTIHYRRTEFPESAAQQFAPRVQDIATLYGLRLTQGRMVFELRPPLEVHKGTAFRQLVSEYQLGAALFLGDDSTDADALLAAREMRANRECYAFGVGVFSADTPDVVRASADIAVEGVAGVETLLDALLNALKASAT
jgi:trehalose 6-phosphate phosphatase